MGCRIDTCVRRWFCRCSVRMVVIRWSAWSVGGTMLLRPGGGRVRRTFCAGHLADVGCHRCPDDNEREDECKQASSHLQLSIPTRIAAWTRLHVANSWPLRLKYACGSGSIQTAHDYNNDRDEDDERSKH